ncbi:hypothetical protein IFT92_05380 [Peribacillus simplex]|uniref:hypothetical protein n=1 Tax=Bacillaceae TaxID=186817 RepID=UPI00065FB46F|nr:MULTISPECIES: hypothetical protein [Bacillaceae]MCP1093643.1 hypothetical protein [Bacillaceae bacterium OS4b]MBD8587236.1 hypothetical protein [Peribacillus simplex]MCF7621422.1 hypothetical protein [Peribacillus frigoritolerans]MCP1152075.1 hypothetical protein [Peribacillus frigoritolerans]MCT1389666.1 hypothetical protein [Peribacillus frigoritolerans]
MNMGLDLGITHPKSVSSALTVILKKKHDGSCECSMRKDKKEEKCQIHKQKKCKCRDGGNNGRTVVDFQYDVARPNVFLGAGLADIY